MAADAFTLGIIAGGLATRLGGRDKAWLERHGTPLVLALAAQLGASADAVLVSANRNTERYPPHGLRVVRDRVANVGPLGGLEALAAACLTPWLLTVPVDLVSVHTGLAHNLMAATGPNGAWVEDDNGRQPLVSVWRTDALRAATASAIASDNHAIHALQTQLGMTRVRLEGVRLGNLNTPDDLAAAGVAS